jgi:outer membrane lipoprotein-sorting protein
MAFAYREAANFAHTMIKHLLFCTALLVGATTHAQDDAKARAIVDNLMAKAKGWKSFEAEFTSRLENTKDKLDVKQEGVMKVKGQRFRLQLDKNTVIHDGKILYTYNKDNNEVTLSDPAEMDGELDPSKLITQFEKGFKTQFVEERVENGATVQLVKLFPLEPAKKPYHTVEITVDKAKVEPRLVRIHYKDGNKVTYTLKRFTADVELADGLFVFDKSKYPGVEVNDMR